MSPLPGGGSHKAGRRRGGDAAARGGAGFARPAVLDMQAALFDSLMPPLEWLEQQR